MILFFTLESKEKLNNSLQENPVKKYPKIYVKVLDNPEPGYVFLGNNITDMGIMDNYGNSIDTAAFRKLDYGFDFKMQKNGLVTYYSSVSNYFYALNNKYQIIDSFLVPSNYTTDFHDLSMNADGTYYMLGEDIRRIDMSKLVTGGNTNAEVVGFAIIEFDKNKQKTWEWNTWDHFSITDATSDIDLTATSIRYCHVNTVSKDSDGNLLISSRHMDEVTKISRSTGNLIWRMGGNSCKNNQFNFIGDTVAGFYGFSHQHDIRRLANGNIMLLDNGNLKNQTYSRVVEYKLDEVNKTATRVWEFVPNPSYYSYAMGSCQRLPNGNTFISLSEYVYEVDSTNKLVYYGSNGDSASTYRAYKFVYNAGGVSKIVNSSGDFNFNETNNTTGVNITLNSFSNKGRLSVERHNYRPPNYQYSDYTPSKELNYRWVVSGEVTILNATIKINTQDLEGFNLLDTFMFYQRDGENKGNFTKIATTYNSTTKNLEAIIKKGGEFIVANTRAIPNIAPFLKSPLKESLFNGDSLFKWNASVGGEKYQIQIDSTTTFKSNVVDTSTTLLTYNFKKFDKGTKYYWRVRAINVTDNFNSPWSEVWNVRTPISIPTLLLPINKAIGLSYKDGRLIWNKVKSSTNYALDLSEDSTFIKKTINRTDLVDSSFFYQVLVPYTNYYWRVAGINGDGQTAWSNVLGFKTALAIPILSYPINKAINVQNSDIFDFDKFGKTNFFQYQVSKFFDFNINEIDQTISRSQDAKFTGLSSLVRYFWRVRGITSKDTSDWSEISQFTTGISVPILKFPSNNSTNEMQTLNLLWNKVEGVSGYEIYLSEDSTFINTKKDTSLESKLNLKNLKAATKYFWKVRALSSGGIGSWSLIWNFKTALSVSLVSPELLYPLDKSKDVPTELDFLWKSVNNATSYKIQIALDSTFDTFVINDFSNTISYKYNDLNNNTVHYWRVQSQSGNSISPWSSFRVFVTNISNVLSIPKLLIPSNNSNLNSTKLTFVWNKVRNANSYDLTIAEDDKLILNKVVTPDITDTTFSKILNNKKTYFWAIVAKNQTSISQISPIFKFNVDEINSVDDFENKDIKINKNLDVLSIEVLDNSKQIEIYLYDLNGKELGVNILNNSQNKIELLLPKIELILLKVNYDKKTYVSKILNLK